MNRSNFRNSNSSILENFIYFLNQSRKWIFILLLAVIIYLVYQLFTKNSDSTTVEYDTNLIQQQIKNVGKLVVTEGHFAEVMTYKDQKKYIMDLVTFEKKALVVINADVTVSFDLSKVTYDIDATNKILTITNIPDEEIKIYPEIKFYDVEQSNLNEFKGDDYNKISKIARENLTKKIDKSSLKTNAKNRLVSELSKILLVTHTLGWSVQYKGQNITSEKQLAL